MPERFRDDPTYHQMIRSFSQGNQACLGELYDRYAPALLGAISQILDDHERACDCLQHAFEEIWNKKASYDGGTERIYTWMHRIARSSALAYLKNGYDLLNTVQDTIAPSRREDVPQEVNNASGNNSALSPGEYGDPHPVLHLVYMKGLTIAEAAKRLNISIETAKFQLISAIRQFKSKVST